MATQQLVSQRQKPMPTTSYGDKAGGAVNGKLWKAKLQRRYRPARDVHRLGFKNLVNSVSGIIMNKAKAIYGRVFRDFVKRTPRVGNEVMSVDPYFSVPVIPATSSTLYLHQYAS